MVEKNKPLDLSSKKSLQTCSKTNFSIRNILTKNISKQNDIRSTYYYNTHLHKTSNYTTYPYFTSRFDYIRANLLWRHYMHKKSLNQLASLSNGNFRNFHFSPQTVSYHPTPLTYFYKLSSIDKKHQKMDLKFKKGVLDDNKQSINTYSFSTKPNSVVKCNEFFCKENTKGSNKFSLVNNSSVLEDSFECKLCHKSFWSSLALANHDCSKMVKKKFRFGLFIDKISVVSIFKNILNKKLYDSFAGVNFVQRFSILRPTSLRIKDGTRSEIT